MRVGPYARFGSLDAIVEGIRRAAADGFPTVWTHQAFGPDPFVAAAVAGAAGPPGIEIGTAVTPIFLRHPQALAAEALTTQAAVGGCLTLGIGLGHRHVVEGRLGLSYERPAEYMREYLAALLPLLRGEAPEVRGRRVAMIGGLDPTGVEAPPVLLGALAPQMLRLAGSLVQGTITAGTGPRGLAEHIVPAVTKAAADAGRPPPRIVVALSVCITDDVDAARARIGATSTDYARFPAFKAMLDREGVSSALDVGIIGSEEQGRAYAERLFEAGATDLAARETTGTPEEAERTRAFLRSLVNTST